MTWKGKPVLDFLRVLGRNNDRKWFETHKERYNRDVKDPCLELVRTYGQRLAKVSPHFVASDKAVGGSMSRINRDTRFSADKSPYKTAVSLKFPNASGRRDATFYYVHLEPGNSFLAGGLRGAERESIEQVRQAIAKDPKGWAKASKGLLLEGDQLKRVPKGFDENHAHANDLRRKDFCAVIRYKDAEVAKPHFPATLVGDSERIAPVVSFVSQATGQPF